MTKPVFLSDVGTRMDGLVPEAEHGQSPDGGDSLIIPQSVYDNLPGLLSDICEHFAVGFERDVFLTAAITVCSGILSNVIFHHRDKWYHLNLYALIVASAGSGKGDAGLAWNLAELIDDRVYKESEAAIAEWETLRDSVDAIKSRNKKLKPDAKAEPVPDLPARPPLRTLRIAVNSSARGFIDRLQANGGAGVLSDPELKTLNIARKQEWGDSEVYLKGFQNEDVDLDRAGGVCIRIRKPHWFGEIISASRENKLTKGKS